MWPFLPRPPLLAPWTCSSSSSAATPHHECPAQNSSLLSLSLSASLYSGCFLFSLSTVPRSLCLWKQHLSLLCTPAGRAFPVSLATSFYLSSTSRHRLFYSGWLCFFWQGRLVELLVTMPRCSIRPLCLFSIPLPPIFLASTSVTASQTFSCTTCQQLFGFGGLFFLIFFPCKCYAYMCHLFPHFTCVMPLARWLVT